MYDCMSYMTSRVTNTELLVASAKMHGFCFKSTLASPTLHAHKNYTKKIEISVCNLPKIVTELEQLRTEPPRAPCKLHIDIL